ncbi:hypothetical protein [Sulfobacillus harzensis]|uniref:Uncharacterized protein n=1 Tax=Sulfobacillus harzensis TaxID=2729629 RepID=A0A7Y0Q2T4_9FIRM|nr:hypothetical protein [Sulfobacillus harzensis]NMP22877.1 hypothetical protein [Sulfobacillus harzensis]
MGRILAGVGIVVNLFLPGVGTLIMGKWFSGVVQLAVLLVVFLLKKLSFGILTPFVFPISGVIWLWALVGGILTYIDRGRPPLERPRY